VLTGAAMRIVLIRHGKPDLPPVGRLRANEIPRWISTYDAAGVQAGHPPTDDALRMAGGCDTVVCSDLPRSVQSADALGVTEVARIEPVFRETGLPFSDRPWPRLAPRVWAGWFRVLWLFGYASNAESVTEARHRAADAARRLGDLARSGGPVLLVGHGFMNWFIARELRAMGWRGPARPGMGYWEYGVYEC
jgi:broad specificity phosphatase PhoE